MKYSILILATISLNLFAVSNGKFSKKSDKNHCPNFKEYVGEYTDCFFESSPLYGADSIARNAKIELTQNNKGVILTLDGTSKYHFDPSDTTYESKQTLSDETPIMTIDKGGCATYEYTLFYDEEDSLGPTKFNKALLSNHQTFILQASNDQKHLLKNENLTLGFIQNEFDGKSLHLGIFRDHSFLGAMICYENK